MKLPLRAALALLVIVPLLVTAWLSERAFRDENAALERQGQRLLREGLEQHVQAVNRLLQEKQRALDALFDRADLDPEALRDTGLDTPAVRQLFLQDEDGSLLYPSPASDLTTQERDFLQRTGHLWESKEVLRSAPEDPNETPGPGGWHSWFWDTGLQLIYSRELAGGSRIGAEVSRVSFLAEVIGQLPPHVEPRAETAPNDSQIRIQLCDARGDVLYQWGGYAPPEEEDASAEASLGEPFQGWRFRSYAAAGHPLRNLQGDRSGVGRFAGLLGLALALGGLAFYLYREQRRALREANQRVNFVNQVSHELKTPLTNIRMYAELMQQHMEEEDPQQGRLQVIVSESTRLGRLIENVLTFSGHQRGALRLQRVRCSLDDIVQDVHRQFAPTLAENGIVVEIVAGASQQLLLDRDRVAQIVANLVSNANKYAKAGGHLSLTTQVAGGQAILTVQDRGPGIPKRHADQVFEPFYRIGNQVNEGVAGTGLGLALARDLARLHGGDLVLEPSQQGVRLRLTLDGGVSEEKN